MALPPAPLVPLNICIVSDFFLPRLGGVELHQYCLAQALINLGHHVIIVSGSYGPNNQRQGVRYLTSGLKVYYLPQIALHNQVSAPTLFTLFPLFRNIIIREGIDIVHGHQTTSPLAHQCIMYGKVLNKTTIFTDHSMFGISTPSSIHVNKLGRFTQCGIDHIIAVSHTLRENIVVRTGVSPTLCSVIPNALDHTKFKPAPHCVCFIDTSSKINNTIHNNSPLPPLAQLPPTYIRDKFGNPHCSSCHLQRSPDPKSAPTFVILSRLVYRKGIEFIAFAMPIICKVYPQVRFVIGGDGPHLVKIRDMLQTEGILHRVQLLGEVPHHKVCSVLQMGHIFINTSLTETFCIAIVEAMCSGLHVVATRVGGVPEVLPQRITTTEGVINCIEYCDPNHVEVLYTMEKVLLKLLDPGYNYDPMVLHRHCAPLYNWYNVAARTINVYQQCIEEREKCKQSMNYDKNLKIVVNPEQEKINNQYRLIIQYWTQNGYLSSFLFVFVIVFTSIIDVCCGYIAPASDIEPARKINLHDLQQQTSNETNTDGKTSSLYQSPLHQTSDGWG